MSKIQKEKKNMRVFFQDLHVHRERERERKISQNMIGISLQDFDFMSFYCLLYYSKYEWQMNEMIYKSVIWDCRVGFE